MIGYPRWAAERQNFKFLYGKPRSCFLNFRINAFCRFNLHCFSNVLYFWVLTLWQLIAGTSYTYNHQIAKSLAATESDVAFMVSWGCWTMSTWDIVNFELVLVVLEVLDVRHNVELDRSNFSSLLTSKCCKLYIFFSLVLYSVVLPSIPGSSKPGGGRECCLLTWRLLILLVKYITVCIKE